MNQRQGKGAQQKDGQSEIRGDPERRITLMTTGSPRRQPSRMKEAVLLALPWRYILVVFLFVDHIFISILSGI